MGVKPPAKNTTVFSQLSYVCPEPVLVKDDRFNIQNGSNQKKEAFRFFTDVLNLDRSAPVLNQLLHAALPPLSRGEVHQGVILPRGPTAPVDRDFIVRPLPDLVINQHLPQL
jgi:hypothetical protein